MLKKILITGLGTGYLPIAPGTWGSLVITALYLLLAWAGVEWWLIGAGMLAVAAASSVGCIAWGGFAEAQFGKKDPGRCTLDEFAGQALTYAFLPLSACPLAGALASAIGAPASGPCAGALWPALAGFLAFRLMDILKPPPARQIQVWPRGWGIVMDDLIAGVYANALCQVLLRVWP